MQVKTICDDSRVNLAILYFTYNAIHHLVATCRYHVRYKQLFFYTILCHCAANSTRNSPGDEIANVNFYDDIVHVEASAYAH